jgi:hypothetical protein
MKSEEEARLWAIIVTYGLEEEYEHDWLGRIKSKSSRRYLRADITPELAQTLAQANAQIGQVATDARVLFGSARERVRGLLAARERPETDLP